MWKTSTFGEKYIESCNRRLFERAPSKVVFSEQVAPEFYDGNLMHIVVGSDSGLLIKHLIEKGLADGACYVFIEKVAWCQPIRESVSIPETLSKRVLITTPEQWQRIARQNKLSDYAYQNALKCQQSLASLNGLDSDYAEIHRQLEEELVSLRYEANANMGGMAYTQLQLMMLSDMGENAGHVFDEFEGYTAVVLGAGPSVDELLPWVIENRQKLVVFSVSRLSRRLLEVGLTPDFIVTVDPQDLSFYVSREMFQLDPKPVLIHSWHASDMILSQWVGRKLVCGAKIPWESPLNGKSFSVRGPTVSNQAVNCAMEMGFSQVVVGGLDFCFSKEGFSHAKGNTERELGANLNKLGTHIETNEGHLANTTAEYRQAAEVLSEQARVAEAMGLVIINPSLQSAKVDGVVHRSLEDIRFLPLEEPVQTRIDRLIQKPSDEKLQKYYKLCFREIDRVTVKLHKMRTLCVEAIKYNARLFDEKYQGQVDFKKKMDRVEKKFTRNYPDLLNVIKVFGMFDLMKLDRFDDFENATQEEVEEAGASYYRIYRRSIDNILKILEVSKNRTILRQDELNPQGNFNRLATIWIENGQAGRYRVWQARHGEDQIHDSDALEAAQLAFEKSLNQDIKKLMQSGYRYQELNGILSPAMKALAARDRSSLERVLPMLENSENDQAGNFILLIRAYLSELSNNMEEAMESYARIIESGNDVLQEEALNRIVTCNLVENPEQAVHALECLTQFASKYFVPLADLLSAYGCDDMAIESYEQFLAHNPTDLAVLAKKAKVYKKMGLHDKAHGVAERMLQLDPKDSTAQSMLLDTA